MLEYWIKADFFLIIFEIFKILPFFRVPPTSSDVIPTAGPSNSKKEVDPEYVPPVEGPVTRGRKRKNFEDLKNNQKKVRLDPMYQHILQTCKEHEVSFYTACAYACKRYAYSEGNCELGEMYSRLAKMENPLEHRTMSVEKAVALGIYTKSTRRVFEYWRLSVKNAIEIPGK